MSAQNPAAKVQSSHPATIVQGHAADPARSVWVGASAGTGKTKVLIDRVLRLMLPRPDGGAATEPGRILCLTFTKTAAAEMSNRIYAELADWSVLADDKLAAKLAALAGVAPDDAMMAAARRLFARVLDTPGGLKIMTIHSFCQSVLKRFPIEAGLAPHFALMDEITAKDTLTQCLHDLIDDSRKDPAGVLARSFEELGLRLNSADLTDLLQKMMAQRARLSGLLEAYQDRDGSAARLVAYVFDYLGVDPAATPDSIRAGMLRLPPDAERALRDVAALTIERGTDAKRPQAIAMADWLAGDESYRRRRLSDWLACFFTTTGETRKTLTLAAVKKAMPDAEEVMQQEAARLSAIDEQLAALRLAQGTAALLTVSADMLGRYSRVKAERDALDFDDLIIRTRDLLASDKSVQWVQYKLDEGIDHILVDEAQDTSPMQWLVVRALAEEFFAGTGARDDVTRTLFVVGDEKQSIFSFQGADPAAFHAMKTYFSILSENVQQGFALDLQYSFRSTAAVLSVVDAVFNQPAVRQGVVHAADTSVVHLPFREGDAGHVELWPLVVTAERPAREAWSPATELAEADNAASRLARQIAETIRGWLDRGEKLESQNRPIRAGDVLILTQSRNELVQHLMRALKSLNIPVAGADRMKLRQEIAVMDMLAAARFALQPRDDLMLAALLKSPLCGVDEDALFALCHGRPGTLWSRLHDMRPDLVQWLQPLVAGAGRMTPYEFFAGILAMPCPGDAVSGRRAFYGRLGRDVADALDEFLNSALSFEQSHTPALQSFADWFARNESDIKREQDAAHIDQVRIMTVHASKGLQAPIVFLPDTTRVLHAHNRGRVRLLWPEEDRDAPLWAASSDDQTAQFNDRYAPAARRQDEEYRRLLYVALTRAEDRLYIAGFQGRRNVPDACWYNLVAQAFPAQDTKDDGTRILRQPQSRPPREKQQAAETVPRPRAGLPAWARQMAPEEKALSRPLAPSRPGEDEPAVKSPLATTDESRFARGIILHRLLEILPQLPAGKRDAAMRHWLARPAFALDAAQQEAFAAEIARVLADPEFAPIFGPGSRAEVPLVGIAGETGADPVVMAGVIDRLLVTGDEILIVDYKTNRPPPTRPEDVPAIYKKQLAAYAAVLAKVYPLHRIKCALLWTDGPRLMPMPADILAPYMP